MSDTTEIPVALEGVETGDGRLVEPEALTLPIGAVPVTGPGPQGLNSVVGKAVGFRREGDTIFATIDLFEGDLPDNYSPAIDIDDVGLVERDGLTVVVKGRVRMVHLSLDAVAWHDRLGRG